MAVIGEIAVNVVARIQKFSKGMKKASSATTKFSKSATKSLRNVTKAIGTLTGFAGVGGLAAVTLAFHKSRMELDALAKTSAKLGIASKNLSGLMHAAKLTGVEANTLSMGLQRFTRRLSEASVGTGEAQDALIELGIDATKLVQVPLEKQFAIVADRMNKVASQSDRVRLSFKLFDSEGVALVNTLKLGSKGLAEMQAEAEKLGLAFSESQLKDVERFNDAVTKLQATLTGVARKYTIEIAGKFDESVEGLLLVLSGKGPKIGGVFGGALSTGSKAFGAVSGAINKALGNTTGDIVRRQIAAGVATGTAADPGILARANAVRSTQEQSQRAAARRGLLLDRRHRSEELRKGIGRRLFGSANANRVKKAVSGLDNILAAAFKARSSGLSAANSFVANRLKQGRRFDELLAQPLDRPSTRGGQGVNAFIESTSAEGFAAIKRSQKANAEPLLRVNKSILAELKNLGVILGRGEELVGVGP